MTRSLIGFNTQGVLTGFNCFILSRVNVKNERPLQRIDRIFHTVTTTDDPVIRKLVKTETGANVFVTDAILATLMCASRSAYSWDIVVQKIGGKVWKQL